MVAGALWRRRDPAEVALWAGGAFVLLSPTVHPWYVIWAWVPSLLTGVRAWTALATAAPLAYAVLATLDPATGQVHATIAKAGREDSVAAIEADIVRLLEQATMGPTEALIAQVLIGAWVGVRFIGFDWGLFARSAAAGSPPTTARVSVE